MDLTTGVAHLVCAGFVAADLWSRSYRMQVMVAGAGSHLRFRDSFTLTAFGDAAAAVTPWRAGGEIGRILGARFSRVPTSVIIAVLSVETVIVYVLAAAVGAWLTARFGGDWLSLVRQQQSGAWSLEPGVVYAAAVITLLMLFVIVGVPQIRGRIVGAVRGLAKARDAIRGLPASAVLWCIGLSVISLVARVGVLPVLAWAYSGAPPGAMALVSFALVHGQMALPTPGGAGPIELAFTEGAVGFTHRAGLVLGWWRVYMTLTPVIVGFGLGALVYGRLAWQVIPFRKRTEEEAHVP